MGHPPLLLRGTRPERIALRCNMRPKQLIESVDRTLHREFLIGDDKKEAECEEAECDIRDEKPSSGVITLSVPRRGIWNNF